MKFIIVTPDRDYFAWQILVQLTNLRRMGYEKNTHIIIGTEGPLKKNMGRIVNNRVFNCKFHVYQDDRTERNYRSSMRPYLLDKFFSENPNMYQETFMYLDPDVLFIKPMDFDKFTQDDIWYVSNTKSYIDSKYIRSKGEEVLDKMCEIVGISRDTVIANDDNAGGAQYIMKNVPYGFWNDMYKISEKLYTEISELNKELIIVNRRTIEPESNIKGYNPLQIWCADMWVLLWLAWKYGKEVKIHPDLDFVWANYKYSDIEKHYLYHNAGKTKDDARHFSKLAYPKSPFKQSIRLSSTSASLFYLKEIKRTEEKFPTLLW